MAIFFFCSSLLHKNLFASPCLVFTIVVAVLELPLLTGGSVFVPHLILLTSYNIFALVSVKITDNHVMMNYAGTTY